MSPKTQIRVADVQPPLVIPRVTQIVASESSPVESEIVGHHTTALTGGHIFVHLEAKGSHVTKSSDFIIPTDEKPGAPEAGVAQFIDFVVAGAAEYLPSLQREWIEGLATLDKESHNRFGQDFSAMPASDQILFLTEISLPERDATASHPCFPFYKLVKGMTLGSFYSSRVGLFDVLEYKGLTYLSSFPGCTAG